MSKLQGEILSLPKMSGSVSTPKSLSGNVGAKTINIGGRGTLFVTFDENMTASHTPAEMAEHIANGGKVFVALDGEFAAISACNAEMAAVVIVVPDVEGGTNVGVLTVDADKSVSVVEVSSGGGITVDDALDENSTNPVQNKVVYEAILGIGQKAAEAYNYSESASMAATAAQTIANKVAERLDSVPNPSDAPVDGFAVVTKGGKWGLSDAPVATMSDFASVIEGVSVAHERIDALDEKVDGLATGGGDCNAIIDVVELPTENIREDCFYRLLTGTFVYNQYQQNNFIVHPVEELPETGEPAVSGNLSDLVNATITTYYNLADGGVYGYIPAELSVVFGVPSGWYPVSVLMGALDYSYSGVITDILEDPVDESFRLLLETVLWSYKDGKWTSHKTIGWAGDGNGAEVFNHPSNKAYGIVSHAEGRFTVAGVEGVNSYGQHAEGRETKALGEASHAEGWDTTASGDYSHAQGRRNIEDTEGKYAHIVGNGDGSKRSNAHTLDWNGLGWFAGGLKVGGTGQDDPNAEEILTKSQVQALIDEAIAKLNL